MKTSLAVPIGGANPAPAFSDAEMIRWPMVSNPTNTLVISEADFMACARTTACEAEFRAAVHRIGKVVYENRHAKAMAAGAAK